MSKVTNTAVDEQHPEWLMGGNPNAIERQEDRGQQELVNAEVLPSAINSFGGDQKTLEDAGVVFGDIVDGDPIFRHVNLPKGWKKQATEHSMHIELLDVNNKVRANIFYKAAFYDRRADMTIIEE